MLWVMPTFRRELHLPASPRAVWDWHAEPAAFDRLVPPWLDVEVVERYDRLGDGARLVFDVRRGPLGLARIRWVARHEDVRPGEGFVDVQESGPFAHWRHEHRFEPAGSGCRLVDEVEYRLPLAPVSETLAGWMVRRDLDRMFAYRHEVTGRAFAADARPKSAAAGREAP